MTDMSDVTSLLAIAFSVTAFIITFVSNRKLSAKNAGLQRAVFHMDRNAIFEGRLAEWPETFKLYGVDLQDAEKEGVTKELIAYLVLSFNSLTSVCDIEGESVYDQLQHNNYRRRMFDQEITRKAWKYVRRFSSNNYRDVDRYLNEVYGDKFDEI